MKEYIVKGRLENKTGFMSFTVKQELIRCKDCYWFIESEVFKGKDCTHFSGLTYPNPDDYCSYGERKEHETD